MAKKKDETEVKTTAKKTTAKSTAKTAAKSTAKTAAKSTAKTAAKSTGKTAAKTAAKSTGKTAAKAASKLNKKVTVAQVREVMGITADTGAESEVKSSTQKMLSSIMTWAMDAMLYQDIMTISKNMNISIEKAAEILEVNKSDLPVLSTIHNIFSESQDMKKILGKFGDRIQ